MSPFTFSAYPFLFVSILSLTALYTLALDERWLDRWPSALLVGISAGLLSGLTINARSSYLAIVIAAGTMFLAANWWMTRRAGLWAGAGIALAAACVSAYALHAGVVKAGVPAGFEDRLHHLARGGEAARGLRPLSGARCDRCRDPDRRQRP